MSKKIAIPSAQPGGLEAGLGMHFGHCDLYTLIDVDDSNAVTAVTTIPCISHAQGGCLAPVMYLAEHGVTHLLAGGMGMRPLMGFLQNNIQVFWAGGLPTVGGAVNAFLAGQLPPFTPANTCRGH